MSRNFFTTFFTTESRRARRSFFLCVLCASVVNLPAQLPRTVYFDHKENDSTWRTFIRVYAAPGTTVLVTHTNNVASFWIQSFNMDDASASGGKTGFASLDYWMEDATEAPVAAQFFPYIPPERTEQQAAASLMPAAIANRQSPTGPPLMPAPAPGTPPTPSP